MNKFKNTSSNTKSSSRKTKLAKTQPLNDERQVRVALEIFAAVALVIVATYCLYLFLQVPNYAGAIFQAPFYGAFSSLPLPALLVAVFCCLTAYVLLKRKPVNRFIGITSSILVVAFGWLAATQFAASDLAHDMSKCTGLFGVTQSCAEIGYFEATIWLANPISLLLWSVLAIVGIIVLILQLRKR